MESDYSGDQDVNGMGNIKMGLKGIGYRLNCFNRVQWPTFVVM
jgi:hypothetical protein